ncbi:acyltransferase family protein [Thermobifida halotolerans]|uniref:acyltransferase family protein n=1 Tax=Thermobifida halotolerans TaxID=483545 RepID=UPI001F367265|nr:acyltransferase family protein [Thermobifida halotolerans]
MSVDAPASPPVPTARALPRRPAPRRFLPEVQGLRAVAVLLVLVYHLNAAYLPGGYVGVDVFFVISGFLITSLLLREARSHGRISIGRFYVRRVRRILPAATLVLAATAVAAVVLLPSTRLEQTAVELVASAAYVENFVLAGQTVDYLAAEEAPSPVQHFWSLAVEEQFYLVWPLLFLGWAALRPRLGAGRAAAALGGAVVAVIAASFTCSVLMTAADPTAAYYLPFTRMWELAVGGLLAVVLNRWSVPDRLRGALGWAGLTAVVTAAVCYGEHTAFPGHTAALPVLGAAAVIAAGEGTGRYSAGRLLSTGPARFVGDISYALYLWHWPIIVITLGMSNTTELSPLAATLVAALSLLLAWATKIVLEDPVRERGLLNTGRSALAFALSGVLVVAGAGWGLQAHVQQVRATEFDPEVHVGPQALDAFEAEPDELTAPPYPSVLTAEDDLPDLYDDGCQSTEADTYPSPCVYGPADAETAVAIVGDSHAAHWSPALQEVADERGWRLYTFTKSSCAFTATLLVRPGEDEPYTQCQEWNTNVVAELHKLDPQIVFTSSRAQARPYGVDEDSAREELAEGMALLWNRLEEAGITVVALRDTPTTRSRVVECVDLHSPDVDPCTRERDTALRGEDPQVIAAEEGRVGDVHIVDMNDRFCLDNNCPAVIGNVIVYRDSHHITATYSRLLSEDLGERIDAAL